MSVYLFFESHLNLRVICKQVIVPKKKCTEISLLVFEIWLNLKHYCH